MKRTILRSLLLAALFASVSVPRLPEPGPLWPGLELESELPRERRLQEYWKQRMPMRPGLSP
jgi:hypothetical protein